MKKNLILSEIAWCNNNKGASGKSKDFEDGYIEGLKQAYSLLGSKTKKVANDTYCVMCSGTGIDYYGGDCPHCAGTGEDEIAVQNTSP